MDDPTTLIALLRRTVHLQGDLLTDAVTSLGDAASELEAIAVRHGDDRAAAIAILLRDRLARAHEARLLMQVVQMADTPPTAAVH